MSEFSTKYTSCIRPVILCQYYILIRSTHSLRTKPSFDKKILNQLHPPLIRKFLLNYTQIEPEHFQPIITPRFDQQILHQNTKFDQKILNQ